MCKVCDKYFEIRRKMSSEEIEEISKKLANSPTWPDKKEKEDANIRKRPKVP